MRALIWIVEETWRSVVEQGARLLPPGAEVTLLHVADAEAEALVDAGPLRRLGRRPPPPPPSARRPGALADEAAEALLAEAAQLLGGRPALLARRGRPEAEVLRAIADVRADVLVLGRDGRPEPGPRSLGPPGRFVVDHAPCAVLLLGPDATLAANVVSGPRD